ncbi:hypothetical protein HPP92_004384 [Vanilla planifolia]|uniref:Uncharacterized protein n=1 Tax=Vanilla planifolia TaxID=51239 RepID=A0A835VDX5_VANPL|nr:hypothetical protein HPP92_004384 [Vanilla planifolia]
MGAKTARKTNFLSPAPSAAYGRRLPRRPPPEPPPNLSRVRPASQTRPSPAGLVNLPTPCPDDRRTTRA